MKRYLYGLIFIGSIICSSCTKEEQVGGTLFETEEQQRCEVFVPGEITLQLDEVTADLLEKTLKSSVTLKSGSSELDAVLEGLNVKSIERVFPNAGEWEERHRAFGLHRFYRVRYDESKIVETKAGNILSNVPGVITAEPVHVIKSMAEPAFNDPYLNRQWHYSNSGSGANYKSGADINVVPVWNEFTAGSKDVIVSVVDGGVTINHEDLKGVVMEPGADGSRNFYDSNYNIIPEDHGTHVAGTIAAINNNGIGLCGIAGGQDGTGGVRIMSCQIFKPDVKGSGNSAQAIVWGADHGAVISQNSWGYDFENESQAIGSGIEASIKVAVDYFIANAGMDKSGNQVGPMKGGVVIFAAGNDGWRMGWPAAYEPIVAVGAMSSLGTRSYYSNYGDWVDIAAPGGDAQLGPQIWSTIVDGYSTMQGTSMACPHVSGVAALLVSYFGGPGFTNEMLVDKLLGGARTDFLPSGIGIGPALDAYGSFLYGESLSPEKVEDYNVRAVGGGAELSWSVGADENGKVAYAYKIVASKDASDFDGIDLNKLPSNVAQSVIYVPEGAQRGDAISGVINDLEFDSDYYVAISGFDYGRSYSELSEVEFVHTLVNNAPVINVITPEEPWEVRASQTFVAKVEIYDPDSHSITVKFDSGGLVSATSVLGSDGYYQITIDGVKEETGTYTMSYEVSDIYGAKASKTFSVAVLENAAPVVMKEIDNLVFGSLGETVTLNASEYFMDPDGDVLTYTVSHSNPRVAHVNPVGNQLVITPLGYGTDEILVRATDAKKAYAELTFIISVREASTGADIYPSQVTDYLFVSGGVEGENYIEIISSTGVVVYSETQSTSVFAPAKIDMSGLAPGIYKVRVVADGVETLRTIVKL